jgi:hypothetical protein
MTAYNYGISGSSGYVPNDPNDYDEPNPTYGSANRMNTDYSQQESVKDNHPRPIFRDRRKSHGELQQGRKRGVRKPEHGR